MKGSPKRQFNYYIFLAVAFVCIMIILVFANALLPDKDFSSKENRVLKSKPDMTSDSVFNGRYRTNYESYVNDQFPLRNFWIKVKTGMDVLSGKHESNGVFLSDDGYLIEKFEKPDEQNFKQTVQAIKKFTKKYSTLNIYALTAPTSVNILADKLPSNAITGDQNAYIDRYYKALSKSNIKTIDVRKSFQNHASKDEQLYYHSDHHWTTLGAYYAFRNTADKMDFKVSSHDFTPGIVKNNFKGMLASKSGFDVCDKDDINIYFPKKSLDDSVITYVDKQEKSASFYKSRNLDKQDAYTVFLDGNHPLLKIKSATTRTSRLLIVKDSYANCFIPFIAPYFRETVVVDPRYYFENPDKLIKSEKITDVLFLYNANTLSQDKNLKYFLSE